MSDNKINTGAIFKNKNKTAIDDQQAPESMNHQSGDVPF
jgi:hypothetical protein